MPVRGEPGRRITRRYPHPGIGVGRFWGEGPLLRGISNRYGTTFHLGGQSEWTAGRARWASRPGTISLKVPGAVSIERARQGRSEMQVVLFDGALVAEASAALDRRVVAPREHALDSRDGRIRPLAELHRLLLGGDLAEGLEQAVCAALVAFVELVFAPRGSPGATQGFSVAVSRARALLDEQFQDTVTLDELAAHARLDKFQLCRAFREQVGLPPHAYVTHRRVALAQELLVRGVPQAEVAASVGLYDQSLLHRHFKQILGVTPGAFVRGAVAP